MSRADKPLVGQHEVVSYGTCHPEMLRTIDSACPSKDASTFGAMATCEHVLDGGQKVQEFQLGNFIQATYLDPNSTSYIGTSFPLFNQSQVQVRADAGGEGGVIFDSSVAMTQGMFSVTNFANISLANGSVSTAPLNGYQYVPIESVEPEEDVSLEGFTSCNTQATRTTAFYNSPAFLEVANQSAPFLNSLPQYLDGRSVSLVNMIYDYMNVQSIHNETFAARLPQGYLAQARALANYHEYGVFSDPSISGIGNIAGRTMLPSLITAMQRIVNQSDPLLLHYSAMAYKPLLSFFNMTGVVASGELPAALVNYAAAMVLEVRQTPGSEPVIRFQFKNGTDDNTLRTFNMSFPGFDGNGDAPLSAFISAFEPAAVNTTLQWCHVCGQNTDRGCAALLGAAANSTSAASSVGHHDRISPVGAGFLGAGLTFAVMSMALAALVFLGFLTFGRGKKHGRSDQRLGSEDGSVREKVPA
ncbi:hypothetical protein PHLCEN_2v1067 [Hermanssonia centrifuga]|uniref:Histidine acid phosphatase n=1 Tax=Hermanssonia centrifuga TaxID=98765 RepID=A0A2R6S418_9APHY|nr:hypothetical protein PHLCEN_2v1067 [Hermanssonia centrifuga]